MSRKYVISIMVVLFGLAFYVSPIVSYEYVLGPGDALEVHAWDSRNPNLLKTGISSLQVVGSFKDGQSLADSIGGENLIKVARDGRMFIPLLGVFNASGMTIADLEKLLKNKLKNYSRNPQVVVLLANPKKINVHVLGQIGKPGLYFVEDGAPEGARLVTFINLVGGFNGLAGRDKVKIIREGKVIIANLRKLETENDLSQNIQLKDNDTVLVPTGTNRIYILGEVRSPGAYGFVDGEQLIYYLSQAGGANGRAAMNDITIVKQEENGNLRMTKVGLNEFLLAKDKENALALAPGDIIFVPQNLRATWSDIMGSLGIIADTLRVPVSIRDAYIDIESGGRSPRVF
jgi:protein involved in polysaccharide export with SLBB domain